MFNDQLPGSAVSAGADLCLQSIHKIFRFVSSQGSVLHFNSKFVDFNRAKKIVSSHIIWQEDKHFRVTKKILTEL
jgi:arginine/lysine/ornithine decarboxylase